VLDTGGNTLGYAYESRPDERTRKSAYLENRLAWNHGSAGLALRYMQDDWGIHSDTAQAQLHSQWLTAGISRALDPLVPADRANFYTLG